MQEQELHGRDNNVRAYLCEINELGSDCDTKTKTGTTMTIL